MRTRAYVTAPLHSHSTSAALICCALAFQQCAAAVATHRHQIVIQPVRTDLISVVNAALRFSPV